MKRIATILSLFLFSNFIAFSQSVEHHYTVNKGKIANGYIVKKVWLNSFAKPEVQVMGPVFEALTEADQSIAVRDVNDLSIVIGLERKRPFAFVSIPVYSVNQETKQIQQLSSFTLKVTEAEPSSFPTPKAKTTAEGSVLASGDWYKISVKENGIYKLDYDFLQSELGITPSSITTANIRLYGNGGIMHSESNAAFHHDDLVENAIVVVDGGDNKFDQGDYILFYANGPDEWTKDSMNKRFHHRKNLYEDKSYYFLNFDKGPGRRISSISGSGNPNVTVSTFDDHLFHDDDIINIGRIGKKWYGEEFSTNPGKQSTRTFNFNTGLTDSALVNIEVCSQSSVSNNNFNVTINGQNIFTYVIGPAGENVPVVSRFISLKVPVNSGTTSVQLTYTPGTSTGKGYLNYIEILTRRQLSFTGGMMTFRDWRSVGPGNIAGFKVQGANGSLRVWDITNPLIPEQINGSLSGSEYSFSQDASSLHEYVAFDGTQFKTAEFVKKIDNQDLHGSGQVDYIIVTHPTFIDAANKLAEFHRQKNSFRVIVATTEQVYNEFGSGSQDIGAIRNFARMFYQRAGTDTNQMPRNLLLFGDASFDYKDRITNNQNFVPTYETAQSEDNILGYCSDDFFGFLDDNENIESWATPNTLDIGIGRLPVTTESAANDIVDKIMRYASASSLGPWRLSTTILSDNGDGNMHMVDGEKMARAINSHTNLYNETKVHLAAIQTISTPGGERAPDANKMINDQVFKGTFLINYNGHGSITTMAHERILTQDDFNNWKNADKLPIMVTATCDYAKFDDPAYVSAGEMLINKPNGGAIALLTTTQLVYAYENGIMNEDFLDVFFRRYTGNWPTFGDGFRYSKNETYDNSGSAESTLANFRKFVLLGDPALTPAFPRHEIHTEGIADGNTSAPVDTMKALGKYKISGSIRNSAGQVLDDFNGRVYITIYDKARIARTITGPAKEFAVQNNVIYKGKATATNGHFSFVFITPKDLNYDFGKGKISYYAENGETDAAGADTMLTIGGFSDLVIDDDESPIVKPFIGDSLFRDGSVTGSNTLLYVQLFDEVGINVSGNSVGHDLVGILDDDIQHPFTLNDYYETAPNDYTRGYVYFPLSGLSDGKHNIRVKGWDMKNNSGEGTVNFEVVNGKIVTVQNLMNYPNPFKDKTTFVFEHNHPDEDLKAQINIYSTSGYKVRTIEQDFLTEGSRSIELTWDGTDNNGAKLPSGIYVYRINISTDKGIQTTAYQKLVLIR
jgi:hypothetical protein